MTRPGTCWGAYAGQVSLGHAAFYGLRAYTSTLLLVKFGINPWLGMLTTIEELSRASFGGTEQMLAIAHADYVIHTGRIVMQGPAQTLLHDERVKKAYLGM